MTMTVLYFSPYLLHRLLPTVVLSVAQLRIYVVVDMVFHAFVIWILLAAQVKRWHDRDRSGWCSLVSLIPAVGLVIVFVEAGCLRGTVGPNSYGEDPTGDARSGGALSQLEDGQLNDAKVVELDGTTVSDQDLASLANSPDIEELRLGGTSITDRGLDQLLSLKELQRLDISLTGITDAGLERLRNLPKLDTLWLGGTKVSDAGLNSLAELASLREIYAKNTAITAAGIRDFARQRPDCNVHI